MNWSHTATHLVVVRCSYHLFGSGNMAHNVHTHTHTHTHTKYIRWIIKCKKENIKKLIQNYIKNSHWPYWVDLFKKPKAPSSQIRSIDGVGFSIWCHVTVSRWRPWRYFMQKTAANASSWSIVHSYLLNFKLRTGQCVKRSRYHILRQHMALYNTNVF